jgi:hypothetical protein
MAQKWCVEQKIDRIRFLHVPGGMYGVTVAKKFKPEKGELVIGSAGLFDMRTHIETQRFIDGTDGSEYTNKDKVGYQGTTKGLAVKGKKEMIYATWMDALNDPEIKGFMSGAPMLVVDGEINVDWGNLNSWYLRQKHRRMIHGYRKDKTYVMCATDRAMSADDAAKVAKYDLGLEIAACGDGGLWSPHLQVGSKIIRRGYRKSPTWILIYMI